MLPGARERFVPIPEGEAGKLATLRHMAGLICAPDPLVDAVTDKMSVAGAGWGPLRLAEGTFEWVRGHMLYMPDYNNGVVIEEIRTPGYLLHEIGVLGRAIGDCDDYVVLLGALYKRLSFGVTLVAVSTVRLDHVYLVVHTGEGSAAADGITDFPFGWEVPEGEVSDRVEYPV
ncbi:MAG: hypothetical protein L0214_07580 [candidate division NC10 bacterium]|nr:hypothetical protein [candidate division NC10 bacterium]